MFKLSSALFLLLAFTASAAAQDVEVDRYNITARIDQAAGAIDARASLELSNLAQTPKTRLYLRLTKLAKVSGVMVNGAAAQVETSEDRRVTALNQLIITPQASIGGGAKATVDVTYRIEVPEATAVASVLPGEVLMAPEAVWFPMPSTMFTIYGQTSAPFTLTVTAGAGARDFRAASAGALKSEQAGQSYTFEQPLNSMPFFVAGSYDAPIVADKGGVKVEVYFQPGITDGAADPKAPPASGARANINRLTEETGRIIEFFARRLGPPPSGSTFRIISSSRTGNLVVPGALVISEQVLRRDVLNSGTIEVLADAVARMWLDGRVRVRGQESRARGQESAPAQGARVAQKPYSPALLRDSLPRYLAALYFEERFGPDGAGELLGRMRWSYTPVAQARRDAELGIQTILVPTYGAAVFGKGPLVFRLMAETVGRDKFIEIIKGLFAGAQTKLVTTEDLRAALVKNGPPEIEKIFQQWVDSIIEPDIVVGIPQPGDKAGVQRINLRNLGTGDVTVTLLAVTESGKRLTSQVGVPSEDIVSTEIQSTEKIASTEIDPEKLIIQTSYDNDAKPARAYSLTLFNDSIVAFNKSEYPQAEAKLKEAVRLYPKNSLLHAWLARTLAAQKKFDEAINEANAALKIEPPTGSAVAWAYITLGQIAIEQKKATEAAQFLRRALVEADEAPAQFAVREALVKAERAAGGPPVIEDSLRGFITQLDSLIKQPSSDKLFTLVVRNNLKRFVQGLTVTPPTSWKTEILRADVIDANRVSLDVALNVTAGGRDQTGTAVFVLHRAGSGWMLEDVQLFNVK